VLAAVMACGPRAVLSHGAAAALHDLRTIPSGLIDVTAARRRIVDGVRCHASRRYAGTRVDAIPVTTIEQTALDLAEDLHPQRLRSLLEAIERRGLFNRARFDAIIAASPGRRGLKQLREALAQLTDEAPWTQSQLEIAFLELVREHHFPEPHANVLVAGRLVDFHWPAHGVVVELDGWKYHRTRRVFEGDRVGDTQLVIAGCRPIRVTQQRITDGRPQLIADLTQLLSAAP
jgi:very-short-patch-repair endonuclease